MLLRVDRRNFGVCSDCKLIAVRSMLEGVELFCWHVLNSFEPFTTRFALYDMLSFLAS